MTTPLLADTLLALVRQALTRDEDTTCMVYVDTGDDIVHCTARIDRDGDVIVTPILHPDSNSDPR